MRINGFWRIRVRSGDDGYQGLVEMLHAVMRWMRRWLDRDESVNERPLAVAGVSAGRQLVRNGPRDRAPPPAQVMVSPLPADAGLLDRCRTQWQFGDWSALAALRREDVEVHPDRAKLAMLAAAGHQQLGDIPSAKAWAGLVRAWGGDRKLLARLLVGGVYNTLGKAAAAHGQDVRALAHFQQAVKGAGGDESLLVQARSVREVARLGLLQDAAQRIKSQMGGLKDVGSARSLSMTDPRLAVVTTQIELIQHEIGLVHKRAVAGQTAQMRDPHAQLGGDTLPAGHAGGVDVAALRAQSTSQLGQDLWVLERTGYKRGGFFVEFGATDGVRLSNTYLLETAFGWQGICAEPNPGMHDKLRANRRCQVTRACVGAVTGEKVDFVFADEYGGMMRDAATDMHAQKRAAFASMPEFRTVLETTSLHDLLVALKAPREIDYISVDTEGSELSILQTFPFDQWDVRCWTVEHNHVKTSREAIFSLMSSHGYQRVEANFDDWCFRGG
jgi:FkbM family methyltransferase